MIEHAPPLPVQNDKSLLCHMLQSDNAMPEATSHLCSFNGFEFMNCSV